MASGLNKISSIAEEWGPLVLALGTVVAGVLLRAQLLTLVNGEHPTLDIENLYVSVFDWSAIVTGFLFGVYGFMAGQPDGFVGASRASIGMKKFLSYIKRAILIGFVITVASIPMIVGHEYVNLEQALWYYVVLVWFAAFVWSFFAFMRVAYIFGLIVRVPDQVKVKG